eukprot:1144540-Pelagomonas_calceolata.AAC.6
MGLCLSLPSFESGSMEAAKLREHVGTRRCMQSPNHFCTTPKVNKFGCDALDITSSLHEMQHPSTHYALCAAADYCEATQLFNSGHTPCTLSTTHCYRNCGVNTAIIVESTQLFKITVSFGNVTSLISLPCYMSHASIPVRLFEFTRLVTFTQPHLLTSTHLVTVLRVSCIHPDASRFGLGSAAWRVLFGVQTASVLSADILAQVSRMLHSILKHKHAGSSVQHGACP